ncbi:alpha/beta hydrolase [Acidocella sp.]|uniref:alpha/beta hydrolase n=1 Tax=Acidocella sp. TaxID=50710 RepID=UPI003CFDE505
MAWTSEQMQGWGEMSQKARDLAYDNNAAVPDAPALKVERLAASQSFRAAHGGALDLPYGPSPRNRWDLYPAEDPAAPCLVFIHGGYWQWNGREDFACLAEGLRAHGWAVAMPGYSLAPEASLTQIVMEIDTALNWLAAHGVLYGITGKIVVSGWSAGGHMAALALGHPSVSAGLAMSGIYELGPLRDTYLNKALQLRDEEVDMLSPLRRAPVQKPLAIAYGSRELPHLVANSRDLHAHRAASHAPGPLYQICGANHFTLLEQLRDPRGELTKLARSLV